MAWKPRDRGASRQREAPAGSRNGRPRDGQPSAHLPLYHSVTSLDQRTMMRIFRSRVICRALAGKSFSCPSGGPGIHISATNQARIVHEESGWEHAPKATFRRGKEGLAWGRYRQARGRVRSAHRRITARPLGAEPAGGGTNRSPASDRWRSPTGDCTTQGKLAPAGRTLRGELQPRKLQDTRAESGRRRGTRR